MRTGEADSVIDDAKEGENPEEIFRMSFITYEGRRILSSYGKCTMIHTSAARSLAKKSID